ncbi:hypothetical protein BDZ91DRAFT_834329 [Kalaharituber pfeilii]|nr:hypothetical protein BDZ91DRAFT_834329 [Kalaharituber pfeilii]
MWISIRRGTAVEEVSIILCSSRAEERAGQNARVEQRRSGPLRQQLWARAGTRLRAHRWQQWQQWQRWQRWQRWQQQAIAEGRGGMGGSGAALEVEVVVAVGYARQRARIIQALRRRSLALGYRISDCEKPSPAAARSASVGTSRAPPGPARRACAAAGLAHGCPRGPGRSAERSAERSQATLTGRPPHALLGAGLGWAGLGWAGLGWARPESQVTVAVR